MRPGIAARRGVRTRHLLLALAALVAAGVLVAALRPGPERRGGVSVAAVGDARAAAATPQAAPVPCPACDQDESYWRRLTQVAPPPLLGKSAALIEGECGRQLYGVDSHSRRPPASLAKIATALVVAENARLSDVVDVTVNGWELSVRDGSTIMGLEAGMRLTVEELLWGLLLVSGNDAAVQLAEHLGGEQRFMKLVEGKVEALGLRDTRFANPHGLDAPESYTSAFDVAVLGRALLGTPVLREIVSTQFHPAAWNGRGLWNGNWLMYIYPDVVGVKTGFTEAAGGTIVAAVERDGRLLIASVLDSADVFYDSIRLFDWAFANLDPAC